MRGALAGLIVSAMLVVVAGPDTAAGAVPAPPFGQCPAIGADPTCALLIVVTDTGTTVLADSNLGPYDGSDDTLVGILNNSSKNIGSLPLSSASHPIFGFESDGLCSGPFDNGSGTSIPAPAGCPFGSTGYEGPGTAFGSISPDTMSGTVNFATPVAPGASAYFSLEDTLVAADLTPGTPTTTPGGGATPTLVVQGSGPVTVGGKVGGTATLGGGSAPTGSLTFSFFGPADQSCKAAPVFTSPPVAVTGAASYGSATFPTTAAGTYHVVASYSGDANNSAASTACGDAGAAIAVGKAAPTLVTQAGPAIATGASTTDTATLAGSFAATGTIAFKLYGPGDPTCARPAVATWTSNVSGNGNATTGPVVLGAPGTYGWTASYSGDANNAAATTACNDPKESVVVAGATSGSACGDLGTQVDNQLPGQSIASDLAQGFSFGLTTPLSMELRIVLRAKDPASGGFVTLANLLMHGAGAVTVRAPDNGLGPNYARRAARLLSASEPAGSALLLFRIVHCRPDHQAVSAESIGLGSLRP